jgi:hypothetical protein
MMHPLQLPSHAGATLVSAWAALVCFGLPGWRDFLLRIGCASGPTVHNQAAALSPIIGSDLIRLPVSANHALVKAGANGGTPDSPTPVGFSVLPTM